MAKNDPEPSSRDRSPWEKFQDLTKKVIAVPKSEVDKREAEWKQGRAERTRTRTKAG